jgi:D-aspartate ligase
MPARQTLDAPVGQQHFHGETSPGAILLGNEYQSLGLLRQLSAVGLKCVLVDQDKYGPARFSHYHAKFHRSPAYQSDSFWPWLSNLAKVNGYRGWLLIPTDDEQVRQLAEHLDEVLTVFRYAGLDWGVYQHLYDKRLSHVFAQKLGLPVPKTFIPNSRTELPDHNDLEFPVIIKPAIKREFQRYSNKKAILASSPAHIREILDEQLQGVPIEHLLYQELIHGGGDAQWSYCGFFIEGEPMAAFTACRRRQKPPDFGRSSTYVIASYDPEVERLSRKLLSETQYTGLAEVEWKRDARDGRLKFLEINARCWGWHSLASQVVGNLPWMLYEYLVRGVSQHVEPRYGPKWVKWITDIPVSFHEWSRGKLTLREYLDGLKGETVSCEWDSSDPLPFFMQFALLPYLYRKRGY